MSGETTIEGFVARVSDGLSGLPARERSEALAELRSLLAESAAERGEAAAVAALGDPDEYARQVRAALGGTENAEDPLEPQGRVLGMPYDFRGASVDRVGARMWNPADPRVLTPRLFGVGWTINFGALAVKLGMIRPDDLGDEAFERIPRGVANAALAVPVAIAAAILVLVVVSWGSLPAELPTHWNTAGTPDGWGQKSVALGFVLLVGVVPVVLTVVRTLVTRANARARVLSAAVLAVLSSIALGVAAVTIADARGGSHGNVLALVILGSLALSFLLLYVPSRLGLRAEWRDAVGPRK